MSADNQHDDSKMVVAGVVVLIVLMLLAGEAFADQPSSIALESEHLFFIENLLVVIFGFFFCLIGAAHGYSVGSKNDGSAG